jgi:hypothetical protein
MLPHNEIHHPLLGKCGSVITVTSLNNEATVGGCVLCWVSAGVYKKAVRTSPVESLQREYEVGVRWSPACENVSLETEESPPLEVVTKQHD